MKYSKLLYPFLSIICIFTTSTSCSDEGVEAVAVSETGRIVAFVDGKRWKSESVWCYINKGKFHLSGSSSNTTIRLGVENKAIGAYPVSGGHNNANSVNFAPDDYDPISNPSFDSRSLSESSIGEIVITAIDEVKQTVSGTFYSKVGRHLPEEKTISIKVGTFTEIPYTEVTDVSVTSFSAKVDGETFNIDSAEAEFSHAGGLSLRFYGNMISNDDMIAITMPKGVEVGSFEIGYGLGASPLSYYGSCHINKYELYMSESGNLDIASHDKGNYHIAGTFSYDATSLTATGLSISVTEGTFDVVYKED